MSTKLLGCFSTCCGNIFTNNTPKDAEIQDKPEMSHPIQDFEPELQDKNRKVPEEPDLQIRPVKSVAHINPQIRTYSRSHAGNEQDHRRGFIRIDSRRHFQPDGTPQQLEFSIQIPKSGRRLTTISEKGLNCLPNIGDSISHSHRASSPNMHFAAIENSVSYVRKNAGRSECAQGQKVADLGPSLSIFDFARNGDLQEKLGVKALKSKLKKSPRIMMMETKSNDTKSCL